MNKFWANSKTLLFSNNFSPHPNARKLSSCPCLIPIFLIGCLLGFQWLHDRIPITKPMVNLLLLLLDIAPPIIDLKGFHFLLMKFRLDTSLSPWRRKQQRYWLIVLWTQAEKRHEWWRHLWDSSDSKSDSTTCLSASTPSSFLSFPSSSRQARFLISKRYIFSLFSKLGFHQFLVA